MTECIMKIEKVQLLSDLGAECAHLARGNLVKLPSHLVIANRTIRRIPWRKRELPGRNEEKSQFGTEYMFF